MFTCIAGAHWKHRYQGNLLQFGLLGLLDPLPLQVLLRAERPLRLHPHLELVPDHPKVLGLSLLLETGGDSVSMGGGGQGEE